MAGSRYSANQGLWIQLFNCLFKRIQSVCTVGVLVCAQPLQLNQQPFISFRLCFTLSLSLYWNLTHCFWLFLYSEGGLKIMWVDNTHAMGVFSSESAGMFFLSFGLCFIYISRQCENPKHHTVMLGHWFCKGLPLLLYSTNKTEICWACCQMPSFFNLWRIGVNIMVAPERELTSTFM